MKRDMALLVLKDFPGMVSVCLLHAGDYARDGSLVWRRGGTPDCVCELATDAIVRLRGEIAWARQDEADARERAERLEAELAQILAGVPKDELESENQ
jgi:hypothetical protein